MRIVCLAGPPEKENLLISCSREAKFPYLEILIIDFARLDQAGIGTCFLLGNYTPKGLSRVLAALDVTPHADNPDVKPTDVEVLIALTISKKHLKLLNAETCRPMCEWSENMLGCICQNVAHHKRQLTDKIMQNDPSAHPEYTNILSALVEDVNGGYKKRCLEHKAEAHIAKQQADYAVIKAMKVDCLQAGVLRGYVILKLLADRYKDAESMPPKAWGLANSCIAGAIAFDTFCGRKKELERATYLYVMSMLEKCADHLVCSDHKTAKSY